MSLREERLARTRRALVYVALLAVVIAFLVSQEVHRRHEVESLPPDERVEIYKAELESFSRLCAAEQRTSLLDYCAEQRSLLARFPECDGSCRELLNRSQPTGTR